MTGWLTLPIERWMRASSARTASLLNHVPRRVVRMHARTKLLRTLRYVHARCASQRRAWEDAGVRLSDLRSTEVLRRIPFTDAQLLADHPERFFCVPRERLIHVVATSGTSGLQKRVYFTAEDMATQTQLIGVKLCRLEGATRGLAIFRTMHTEWTAGRFVHRGIERAGLFGLLAGTHLSPREHIDLIKTHDINFLVGAPAFIHRMTLEAGEPLDALGVRYILLGAQPWPETLRGDLEAAWGATVLDAYGTSELGNVIASECVRRDGLHVSDVDFWTEVIDPETGEPLEDGKTGELVVTTLSRRGMPLVRYRTGDLVAKLPDDGRCPCGLPMGKISRIRGRIGDRLVIGAGAKVFPEEFDRAILAIPGVTDYQLVIEKEDYKDVLHLTVESAEERADMTDVLTRALLSVKYVRAHHDESGSVVLGRLRAVPCGTLSRDRPKSVRIIDKRDQ